MAARSSAFAQVLRMHASAVALHIHLTFSGGASLVLIMVELCSSGRHVITITARVGMPRGVTLMRPDDNLRFGARGARVV